jgi:hypothetical protein
MAFTVLAPPTLVELLDPEIEATIQRLNHKTFNPDPIAGPKFSRIVSVTSSAYKRARYPHIRRRILVDSGYPAVLFSGQGDNPRMGTDHCNHLNKTADAPGQSIFFLSSAARISRR